MTAAAELSAIRGVARRLRGDRPLDPRTGQSLARSLDTSARTLGRTIDHLRAEAEGRLPEVEAEGTYEGLSIDEATARFASRVVALAVAGARAEHVMAERRAFVAAVDAVSAPPRVQRARGVAAASPTADGAGRAQQGASETSTRAALAVLPKTGNQRRRILDAVAAVARNPQVVGLTDLQLVHATGLSPNSVRPRRGELVAGGWLEASGRTREHHGTEHTVWVLTQKAAGTAALWSTRASA